MAYSYTTYTGNGSTTQYAVAFPYIRREHVAVTVAGIPSTFTWVNNSLIQMDAAPANGAAVRVYRTTPIDAPLVDFADGATLVAADLDTNSRQSIYIQQELDDAQTDNLPNVIPNGNKGDITTSVGGTVWAINNGAVLDADVNASAGIVATKLSFTQAGTGATARTVDSKLKDVVSVKDFGAVGDGTTNDTAAIQAAIVYADSTNNTLYFPPGNYITTVALRLNGGITVKGSGLATTTITRTNLTSETIDGQPFTTIFYVTGGWNHISDLSIIGVVGTISGITFGVNIAAKGSIKNVAINNCLYGITEVAGVFLYEFNNIQAVSCGYGFWFNSTDQKTSLTFNQCYAANTGPAYRLRQTNYSVMNSCAADNCNWGSTAGNPYGAGFGLPTSGEGVYHFIQSDVVLNSPGAEGSYGNGVISAESSIITINSMFSYDCRSEFVPNYGAYPNYAVGPIQCGTAASRLTINNANNNLWTNTAVSTGYPTKPIATVVAFNYDEATFGVDPGLQVTLANASKLESAGVIKGMGPIGKNCANLTAATKAPVAAATMAASQVPTASAFTKVNFDTKEYDTDVCYSTANKRFTPTVAGFYNVNAAVQVRYTGGSPDGGLSVYKNGTQYKEGSYFTVGAIANFGCSSLVYLNGTTDYVEMYLFTTHASAVVFPQAQWSYFQISPVRTA